LKVLQQEIVPLYRIANSMEVVADEEEQGRDALWVLWVVALSVAARQALGVARQALGVARQELCITQSVEPEGARLGLDAARLDLEGIDSSIAR